MAFKKEKTAPKKAPGSTRANAPAPTKEKSKPSTLGNGGTSSRNSFLMRGKR